LSIKDNAGKATSFPKRYTPKSMIGSNAISATLSIIEQIDCVALIDLVSFNSLEILKVSKIYETWKSSNRIITKNIELTTRNYKE